MRWRNSTAEFTSRQPLTIATLAAKANGWRENNFISTSLKITGEGNLNCKTDPQLKAKLMGDRDPERPYGPRHNSVLVGAGVVKDWMSEATDFDGHPRLSGGKVAIGAFESVEPILGALLILR